MSEIDKRELFEQQQKIFEAGAQRADKRTGSFSFLTWSFFIAPLIAGEESPAATLKFAPAEEEDAKAAQASATLRATNDDSPASDLSKTSPEDELAKQPAASLEARAAQLDPTGLLTQAPHEDSPKLSMAKNEPAVATGGGGGGGSSDDADSRSHEGHVSIDHGPINWLTADFSVGSGQLSGGSMLDSVQSDALGDLFSTSIPGFTTLLGGVTYLSNDVVEGIAPLQSALQPALATVTDTVGTLANDAFSTIATLETTVQPVLATVSDTVGTLANDAFSTIATLETTVQPVLATVSDTVGTLANDAVGTLATLETTVQPLVATVADTAGTLANDAVGTIATLETTVQPVLATVSDTVGTLANDVVGAVAPAEAAASTLLTAGADTALPIVADVPSLDASVSTDIANSAHVTQLISEVQSSVPDLLGATTTEPMSTAVNALDAVVAAGSNDNNDNQANDPVNAADPHAPATAGAIVDGVDAAVAPAPGSDADPSAHAVADSSHVAAAHIGSSVLVSGAVTPLLPEVDDASQAAAPESGVTNHPVASAAPVADAADPLLTAMTSQPTTSSQTATSDGAGGHTPDSSASATDVAGTTHVTGSGLTGEVAEPGNIAADALLNTAAVSDSPVAPAIEPVLDSAGISASNLSTHLLQPDVDDTGSGQAGPADTLLALATASDAPIEVPAGATAAPASAASGTSTTADAAAITGDVIALNDAPQPTANVMFTGAQYTDYGVTLSSDIVVPQQPAVSPNDTASAHDSFVQVAGDVQQHAPSPPDLDTTHSIDHLGLRDAIL